MSVAAFPPKGWKTKLALDGKGRVIANATNALVIMKHDPDLGYCLAHNIFTAENILTKPLPAAVSNLAIQPGSYPRAWNASDIFIMQAYLHHRYSNKFSYEATDRAMTAVAASFTFHPVLEWIETQKWDGVPRIDTWLIDAFAADDTPYVRAVGSKFLIAAIRRVRDPGCQFDHMPVFEGLQGIGKSRACRALFGDQWFTDDMPHDLSNKDAQQSLLGVWGIEVSEIAQLVGRRNGHETVKAFLTRRTDRFRPPFGRGFILQPRQMVFMGTTNRDDWLSDETGNRRFWPIACRAAHHQWIAENREKLWAEAATREATGESIWLDTEPLQREAKDEQERRLDDDVWTAEIRHFLFDKDIAQVAEILTFLGVPKKDQDKANQMRVGRILKVESWVRVTKWDQNTQKAQKTWERSSTNS